MIDPDVFYAKASRPNEPSPAAESATAPAATVSRDSLASEFYKKAAGPGDGRAVQPEAASPADPAAIAQATSDLEGLGVVLPEGFQVLPAVVAEFAPLAREANLSPAHAQEFVNIFSAALAAFGKRGV